MTRLISQDERTLLSVADPRLDAIAAPKSFQQIDTDELPWIWRGTIPSLNGLRAISILVVIASHLSFSPGLSWLPRAGEMGVEMFFVVSGFLITLLLLRERQRTGTVSLRSFYVRRALRILPAYFFFLATVAVLEYGGVLDVPVRAWMTALTYTSSMVAPENWDLGHTWSLSVEEHFYLAWPFLFMLLSPRRALLAVVGCVLATPFVRLALFALERQAPGLALPSANYFTLTRMDAIAIGCCLAFCCVRPGFVRATRLSVRGSLLLVGACLGALAAIKLATTRFEHWPGMPIFSEFAAGTVKPFLMVVLLWTCLRNDCGWLTRLLSSAPLTFVGLLSYSIYLWQQIFLNPHREHWTTQWPVNLALAGGCALVSYFVVELPFLTLKGRWSRG